MSIRAKTIAAAMTTALALMAAGDARVRAQTASPPPAGPPVRLACAAAGSPLRFVAPDEPCQTGESRWYVLVLSFQRFFSDPQFVSRLPIRFGAEILSADGMVPTADPITVQTTVSVDTDRTQFFDGQRPDPTEPVVSVSCAPVIDGQPLTAGAIQVNLSGGPIGFGARPPTINPLTGQPMSDATPGTFPVAIGTTTLSDATSLTVGQHAFTIACEGDRPDRMLGEAAITVLQPAPERPPSGRRR